MHLDSSSDLKHTTAQELNLICLRKVQRAALVHVRHAAACHLPNQGYCQCVSPNLLAGNPNPANDNQIVNKSDCCCFSIWCCIREKVRLVIWTTSHRYAHRSAVLRSWTTSETITADPLCVKTMHPVHTGDRFCRYCSSLSDTSGTQWTSKWAHLDQSNDLSNNAPYITSSIFKNLKHELSADLQPDLPGLGFELATLRSQTCFLPHQITAAHSCRLHGKDELNLELVFYTGPMHECLRIQKTNTLNITVYT